MRSAWLAPGGSGSRSAAVRYAVQMTSNAALSPEPWVRHYTELLLLPFRLLEGGKPYPVEALSMQAVARRLEALGDGTWAYLPSGALPVELPQPLDEGEKGTEQEPFGPGFDAAAWQHQQALTYFHPTVRSFLFGSRAIARASRAPEGVATAAANDYLRCYRRNDVKRVRVMVWNGETTAEETRVFRVVRCDLALFQPDVGVLQLELQAEMRGAAGEPEGWPLSAVQRVRDELRRLFPPYLNNRPAERGWHGGHCPVKVEWCARADGEEPEHWRSVALGGLKGLAPLRAVLPSDGGDEACLPLDAEALPIFGHWRAWLGPLADTIAMGGLKLLPPGDDRLPSLAFLALDDPRELSHGDWVRLGFADAPGTDKLPYARGSLADFEKRFCYDRFWHEAADSGDAPSRIMNCGYAFTMVGSFADKGFFMNPLNGAWVTFRQIYARMGLVAHFQKAALLGALARLSALAWRAPDGKLEYDQPKTHERLKRFYAEFLEFTQVYWFDEVSPQSQGVELFEMWQRELRSKGLYEEVRQELKDLVEYMNAQAEQQQAAQAQRLAEEAIKQTRVAEAFTRVAAALGVLGVVAGLLGMNWLPLDDGPWLWDASFSWVNFWVIVGAVAATVALAVSTWTKRPIWLAARLARILTGWKDPKS